MEVQQNTVDRSGKETDYDRHETLDDVNQDNNQYVDLDGMPRDILGTSGLWAYAVGHFMNDLCAGMWFVYLSYYIKYVVGLSSHVTGLCVLSGQIADGVTTPLVGLLSDMCKTPCGKRMPFYIFGSFFVLPTFAGIFTYLDFVNARDENGQLKNETLQTAWYITLPGVFNIGWACVQISHMAIVNSLTQSNRKRDTLSNYRNGFTSAANIFVLGVSLTLFLVLDDAKQQFRVLCLLCLGVGSLTSLFYMCIIKEVTMEKQATILEIRYKHQQKISNGENPQPLPEEEELLLQEQQETRESMKHVKTGRTSMDWLKEGTFYVHGMVYMLVRVSVNVTMTMQPFYLKEVAGFQASEDQPTPPSIAIVPLISFVFQLLFSIFLQRPMTRYLKNRLLPMFVAIVIIVIGYLPLAFLTSDERIVWLVYLLTIFQGIGLAIMLNTATSLISDVIGKDTANSAFVYGCYSLFDKFANGACLYYMVAYCSQDVTALRWIMSACPILCSVMAYLLTYIGSRCYSDRMAKITGINQQ